MEIFLPGATSLGDCNFAMMSIFAMAGSSGSKNGSGMMLRIANGFGSGFKPLFFSFLPGDTTADELAALEEAGTFSRFDLAVGLDFEGVDFCRSAAAGLFSTFIAFFLEIVGT